MIADDLQGIFRAIDRLNQDQLAQLRAYVEQRIVQPQITDETPQEKIAALHAAFAEMREGLTEEELEQIIHDMNYEYIEPIDPDEWAWLDDEEGKDD